MSPPSAVTSGRVAGPMRGVMAGESRRTTPHLPKTPIGNNPYTTSPKMSPPSKGTLIWRATRPAPHDCRIAAPWPPPSSPTAKPCSPPVLPCRPGVAHPVLTAIPLSPASFPSPTWTLLLPPLHTVRPEGRPAGLVAVKTERRLLRRADRRFPGPVNTRKHLPRPRAHRSLAPASVRKCLPRLVDPRFPVPASPPRPPPRPLAAAGMMTSIPTPHPMCRTPSTWARHPLSSSPRTTTTRRCRLIRRSPTRWRSRPTVRLHLRAGTAMVRPLCRATALETRKTSPQRSLARFRRMPTMSLILYAWMRLIPLVPPLVVRGARGLLVSATPRSQRWNPLTVRSPLRVAIVMALLPKKAASVPVETTRSPPRSQAGTRKRRPTSPTLCTGVRWLLCPSPPVTPAVKCRPVFAELRRRWKSPPTVRSRLRAATATASPRRKAASAPVETTKSPQPSPADTPKPLPTRLAPPTDRRHPPFHCPLTTLAARPHPASARS
ncbi:bifunctional inhibitor/lipid-transfer protein/seed storage 2S albumin-like protein [Angomonas deanei]|uniref:Uncharacterized protein n=1 Tax=Angomonas deanei TaxID=59799 RepID=A0A7G2CGP9_9TRYP|nr:bifunctional inhibitor/lipid-transfer protein/seed storage 2S albumin-like protein [Angomonas deanei]CAD2218926.1 hypothetical protein, conserved [Angomonas deanei]|eukprot:EPY23463.1 bifunctional inhibitor/lipid-transfer protein/seed storage 2S albumin-like protein [Angomonas deanei]